MTLLGMSAMDLTQSEMQIVQTTKDYNLAFQAAESALNDARNKLITVSTTLSHEEIKEYVYELEDGLTNGLSVAPLRDSRIIQVSGEKLITDTDVIPQTSTTIMGVYDNYIDTTPIECTITCPIACTTDASGDVCEVSDKTIVNNITTDANNNVVSSSLLISRVMLKNPAETDPSNYEYVIIMESIGRSGSFNGEHYAEAKLVQTMDIN